MSQLRVTPQQLVQMVVLEAQIAALQTAANQLAGLKLTDAADVCVAARDALIHGLGNLQRQWQGGVVVVQPGDVKILEGASP